MNESFIRIKKLIVQNFEQIFLLNVNVTSSLNSLLKIVFYREPDTNGGFPIFLMVSVVLVVVAYFVYHNKNKVNLFKF